MSVGATFSAGSFDYKDFNVIGQSGEFGPWGTKAYIQASYMDYEKFRGYGDMVRRQANFRIYQDLGGGDFISIAGNWDPNDNYAYRSTRRQRSWPTGTISMRPTTRRPANAKRMIPFRVLPTVS